MAWATITAAETDQNSPIDQALMDKFRLNDADHETRALALENAPNVYAFSHFSQRYFYGDNLAASPTNHIVSLAEGVSGLTELRDFAEPFYFAIYRVSSSSVDLEAIVNSIGDGSDTHYIRFYRQSAYARTGYMILMARPAFVFNNRVRPIVYTSRHRFSTSANHEIFIGLIPRFELDVDISTTPLTDGIFLMRNGANWRFVTRSGGVSTNGSDITPVADNTWFEVEIKFEDSPSNRARCYIDTVLKETFTTNLPVAAQLYGAVIGHSNSTTAHMANFDTDRVKVYASGSLGNAA